MRQVIAWGRGLGVGLALALLVIMGVWWQGQSVPSDIRELPEMGSVTESQLERGAYLVKVGGCMGCHTAAGGAVLAGGGMVKTPFGIFYGPNLTPDLETGIGRWSRADFHQALRYGVAPAGRLLYPAFPYEQYAYLSVEDVDAMYVYLKSLPAVRSETVAHQLQFGLGSQAALALWRGLYFKGASVSELQRTVSRDRGAYLVHAVAHCAACHASRNGLGALSGSQVLQGSGLAVEGWKAPSLLDSSQAGVRKWSVDQVVQLLKHGRTEDGMTASGPMADAVFWSTQYLQEEDARAVARYLQQLDDHAPPKIASSLPRPAHSALGKDLYAQHCAACHGESGKDPSGIFPQLAGNRAVTAADPGNMLRSILFGGYVPSIAGSSAPVGMPPFLHVLSDADIAVVATYIRQSWGNQGATVATMEAFQARQAR